MCEIENSRHTVIKRERIGLNWFKIFQSFSMKSKAWRSILRSGIGQVRELMEKNAELTIFMLLIWPAAYIHPMCSSTRSYSPHNFNLKLIMKAVQIVDSNKITHMIRCAWNASSMYAAFRIVPQLQSNTVL